MGLVMRGSSGAGVIGGVVVTVVVGPGAVVVTVVPGIVVVLVVVVVVVTPAAVVVVVDGGIWGILAPSSRPIETTAAAAAPTAMPLRKSLRVIPEELLLVMTVYTKRVIYKAIGRGYSRLFDQGLNYFFICER